MHKVKIGDRIYYAKDNELLSDILIKNKIKSDFPCAGKGTCGKCKVKVDEKETLSCQYKVKSDITVEVKNLGEIESKTGFFEKGKITDNLCFCLDLGSTTLALALVSIDEKKIIQVKTAANPQRSFGADVISRIDFCTKNGVAKLKEAVTEGINKLIKSFNLKEISDMFVAGNTTMLHILLGANPESIGKAPYTPVFLEERRANAESLGITGVKNIITLQSISSFVGADLVAGLSFAEKAQDGKYNMLIDLGTNAEIILYSEKTVLSTSAAAGPCFEGANISCGMSATGGAVCEYKSRSDLKTIGNKTPCGICGTGLVDIMAVLLKNKIIDETGFMECGNFCIAENIFLTQEDVRQYQLAKSAIYSAVICLIKEESISYSMIDKVYISGGFSSKINAFNAAKTGLLPKELADKCIAIGNSSLLGTAKYATEKTDLTEIVQKAKYIDLSLNQSFSDLFMKNMMFNY